MSWTYQQLATAISALASPPADFYAIAAILNAQTQSLVNQPTTYGVVRGILKTSSTADWSKIVARAKQAATLPPVSGTDVAILGAILITTTNDTDVLDPNNAAFWTTFNNLVVNLAELGDLSAGSSAAILALISTTGPVWAPAVTGRDVWIAKGQPA